MMNNEEWKFTQTIPLPKIMWLPKHRNGYHGIEHRNGYHSIEEKAVFWLVYQANFAILMINIELSVRYLQSLFTYVS